MKQESRWNMRKKCTWKLTPNSCLTPNQISPLVWSDQTDQRSRWRSRRLEWFQLFRSSLFQPRKAISQRLRSCWRDANHQCLWNPSDLSVSLKEHQSRKSLPQDRYCVRPLLSLFSLYLITEERVHQQKLTKIVSALKHTLRACYFWFRIEVQFKGYPPPIISWYRDNFEIHPSHDFQVKAWLLSHMVLSTENWVTHDDFWVLDIFISFCSCF